MNTYKALRDFGVQDESSTIYGSHVAGSEVILEAYVAQAYVENGDLELVSTGFGAAAAPEKEEITEATPDADEVAGSEVIADGEAKPDEEIQA